MYYVEAEFKSLHALLDLLSIPIEARKEIDDLIGSIETRQADKEGEMIDRRRNQDEDELFNSFARAVVDFAEWHSPGYDRDANTKAVVSSALWEEVSNHVFRRTGIRPPNPCPVHDRHGDGGNR